MLKRYGVRKAISAAGTALSVLCVIAAVVPLGAMIYYVLQQGGSYINVDFFTQLPAPITSTGGGMANAIVGTLYLMLITSVIGLPVGIFSGIYLARTTSIRFAHVVRFLTDVVAGTPSIIAGIVVYALIVIPMARFSALAAGIALALLMFPTVTRATEEAIRLVPGSVREASLALGIPEWKTMMRIIVPAAGPGIITAVILGIARVAGETAPLIFTAFGTSNLPGWNPLNHVEGLPLQIWTYATGPYDTWHRQAWAGAFVLFAMIVILNLIGRVFTYRLAKRIGSS